MSETEDTEPLSLILTKLVGAGACWMLGMLLVIGSAMTTWFYIFPMLEEAGILDPLFWLGIAVFVFWCGAKLLAAAKLLSGQDD